MIIGTFLIPRVVQESVCRIAKDYYFTDVNRYQIHSTTLMPNIPFEESLVQPQEIDASIFLNDTETKLDLENNIQCQNFLTTKFVGRAPLEWAGQEKTKMGRQFVLICRDGNPSDAYRVFGTEAAIRGYNRGANENVMLPGGGEG